MNAYFDSGVLVKNYSWEENSPTATALLQAEALPLPLTPLQEIEIRNALRLKFFRKEISAVELNEALRLLDFDLQSGLLERVRCEEAGLYRRAESLSRQFSGKAGTRTLDLLHIAAAQELGASRFISFDQRQRAVAKNVGLLVLPRS